jgi:hypothetical protein
MSELGPDNYTPYLTPDGGKQYYEPQQTNRKRRQKGEASKHLQRIQRAEKLRDENGFDDLWSDMNNLYASRYDYPELGSYKDVVAPNLAFSTVNVIVPSIAMNNPKIMVSARAPEKEAAAMVAETVVNYQWERYSIQDEVQLAAKDFSIFGHGWIKTVWDYQTSERDRSVEEFQAEFDRLTAMREQAIGSGMAEEMLPGVEEIAASIEPKVTVVTKDEPLVYRVSVYDIFVDPDAMVLKDARWIAHRMLVPIEVARKDERWNRKARADLKATAVSKARETVERESDVNTSDEANFAVVYEYYDLVAKTVCTISDGCEGYLRDPEPIPYKFGHPFVFMPNYIVPERFYPIGDIESIFALQVELATTRTQMVNDRKRYRRVYFYRPTKLGPDSIESFLSGEDEVMLEVTDETSDFREIMAPLESINLPAEFYNQTQMIEGDINVVSGVNEYQRGNAAPIRRTATEAAMLSDSANARSAEKLARIEAAVSKIASNLIVLNQQFMEGEQVARITGPNGAVDWMTYTQNELAGEFDFKCEAGSTRPTDDTFRRQQVMELLEAVGPYMGTVIDPRPMVEHVFRQFGIRDADRFLIPQQPMMPGMPGDPSQGMNPAGAGPEGVTGPQGPAGGPLGSPMM